MGRVGRGFIWRGPENARVAAKQVANEPHLAPALHSIMKPMSFGPVEDLLEDTITRSAKSQSDADGELTWLRKRLDNERRDPRSRGKLALEGGNKQVGNQARALLNQAAATPAGAQADKENALLATSAGYRANKVRSVFSVGLLRVDT